MRILVTGNSGFVGRALVGTLAERDEVAGLSRTEHPRSYLGDLLDPTSLRAALTAFAPDVVVNCAAVTNLKGVPAAGFSANTTGVRNLIDAVAEQKSVRRTIWLSSQLVSTPGRKMASETDYAPVDEYGASKAEGELIVRATDGGGTEWVIVRTATIWGPGMSEHYQGPLRMIRRGLYFHPGRQPIRKSSSYIDNLADQLATLVHAPAETIHGKTIYLADSEPLDLRKWADDFARHWQRRIPSVPLPVVRAAARCGDVLARMRLPAPLNSRRLANMLNEYVYDTSLIEQLHGPTAVAASEGVARTVKWLDAREEASRLDVASARLRAPDTA